MSEPDDKVLDEYLQRESAVSRRYRELPPHDVPTSLDETVLTRARAAIEPAQRKPAWVRWTPPLALAATAVLVAAIVLDVGVMEAMRIPTRGERAASSSDALVESYATEKRAAEPASAVRQAPPAAAADPERTGDATRTDSMRRGPPAPVAPAQNRAQRAVAERPIERDDRTQTAPRRTLQTAAESRSRSVQDQAQPNQAPSAQPMSEPPAPAPAAAIASVGSTSAQSSRLSETPKPVAAEPPRLPPEAWLQQIRELRRAGKTLEADEQWRQFSASYPEFEVSESDPARPAPSSP